MRLPRPDATVGARNDKNMIITDKNKIEEVLMRGVENVYPSREALEKVLLSGKKLRIYNGIDPTGKLHIGHGVVLKKLRQFQDLGHEVIVLIGDFTARIGDPTGKSAARKKLAKAQVEKNAANYKKLIGKILDLNKKPFVRFLHNEKWTNKLKPEDILELASYFTVSRLLERDMFQNRLKAGKEIYVHEFLYPIFQAYDSVTMDIDLEIGGNDQTFNMLAGRTLMRKTKNKEKFVLTTKLLTDPSGKKMGKTEGNMINLDESAEEMYGKIMSWPDELIGVGFEICTDVPMVEVDKIKHELKAGGKTNPRDLKMRLAFEVIKIYHGEKEAAKAQEYFVKTVQKGEMPNDVQIVPSQAPSVSIIDYLVEAGLATSKSDARRKIEQGGVYVEGKRVESFDLILNSESDEGKIITVGKRHHKKIIF